MKDWARRFYHSKRWLACRAAYIGHRMQIDGGLCEECVRRYRAGELSESEINHGFIVHHKVALTEENIKDPMVALNFDNLSYECKLCHDEHEGHGLNNKRKRLRCSFDEDGQPIL